MIPGTTPTLRMRLKDDNIDLGEADSVYVTLRQGGTEITKSDEYIEVDGNRVSVWLEQADTLNLRQGSKAKVQVNWTYSDALDGSVKRNATKPKEITISEQLLMRVIT